MSELDYAEEYRLAREGRAGADRMALGLPCIPDSVYGDLERVEKLEGRISELECDDDEPDKEITERIVRKSARHDLPFPRLQLTWMRLDDYNWFCRYDLLLKMTDSDSRGNDVDEYNGVRMLLIEMGSTTRGTEREPITGGVLDTPYRDGAHIQWDGDLLILPKYVVWNDRYNTIDEISNER